MIYLPSTLPYLGHWLALRLEISTTEILIESGVTATDDTAIQERAVRSWAQEHHPDVLAEWGQRPG